MSDKIKQFLDNFQDYYVKRTVDLTNLGTNLSSVDLRYTELVFDSLKEELEKLNNLSKDATQEALSHYKKLFQILHEKLDYIEETTEVFNYINTTFDRDSIVDLYNFNLRYNGIAYNSKEKALTLKSISSLFKCPKVVRDTSITFYNTSSCSHSGLYFDSNFLKLLDVTSIVIRRTDGTLLDLDVTQADLENYIRHEALVSAQIDIQFGESVYDYPQYLQTIDLHLIDFTYERENHVVLESTELKAGSIFSFITSGITPDDTYVNINVALELLDVNGNEITKIVTTLPVNSPYVCKRLDQVDYKEVESIYKLYIKDKSTTVGLSKTYLDSLDFKEEYFVIYKTKESIVNQVNKYVTRLGNTSFRLSKTAAKIRVSPTLELYSFKDRLTPTMNYITGVSKNVEA